MEDLVELSLAGLGAKELLHLGDGHELLQQLLEMASALSRIAGLDELG